MFENPCHKNTHMKSLGWFEKKTDFEVPSTEVGLEDIDKYFSSDFTFRF